MHPSSILSYYPTYSILDDVISDSKFNHINFYIDLKNCLQSIYMEHVVIPIVESCVKSRFIDTSIFSSLIYFLSFHKKYCLKRNITCDFYIFYESGKSSYHLNILPEYKINRTIGDLYGLDHEKKDLFFKVLSNNYQLMEKFCQKTSNIFMLRLPNFEADFIPYYLVKFNLVKKNDETCANILYSNDHDMLQFLTFDRTFVFRKLAKSKRLVKNGSGIKEFFSNSSLSNVINENWIGFLMSIMGDPSDSIPGVKGIGIKTLEKIISFLDDLDVNECYDKACKNENIFSDYKFKEMNKYINKIIENESIIRRNLMLCSFEVISNIVFSKSHSLKVVDINKLIVNSIQEFSKRQYNQVLTDPLYEVLSRLNITVEYEDIDILLC